ncbi:BcsE family c-di-GMP-binding protein [Pseudoalteromonas sp. Hal099]
MHPFRFSADTRDWPKQQIINNTLKELNAYKQLNNALVIVHFSTTDLASLDQKQLMQSVQAYKKFSTQSGATVLFLVSGPEVTNYRFLLRRLNSDLDGLVYVENDSTVRVLEYDYWHHQYRYHRLCTVSIND